VSEALYGSPPAAGRVGGPYDPDQLLAGYRAAWAQKPLFDARSGGSGPAAYDEFVDAAGNVRPGCRELLLSGMHSGLRELADVITATQLSLPGEMQPLWGPDLRRVVP
jgi:hypothetical protein